MHGPLAGNFWTLRESFRLRLRALLKDGKFSLRMQPLQMWTERSALQGEKGRGKDGEVGDLVKRANYCLFLFSCSSFLSSLTF